MEIPKVKNRKTNYLIRSLTACSISIMLCIVIWTEMSGTQQSQTSKLQTAYSVEHDSIVRAFGQLKPQQSVSVIAQVAGRVIDVQAKAGSFVNQGDLLLTLNNRKLHEDMERLELDLLTARANLNSHSAKTEQIVLNAENEITLAEGDVALLKAELDAKRQLVQNNIISTLEFERAKASVVKGTLSLQAKIRNLASLKKVNIAETKNVKLALKRAEQLLNSAKAAVEELHLKADISGVITQLSKNIEIGTKVGQDEFIAQIADTHNMYAQMSVNSNEASAINVGQAATITINGIEVSARVSRVSPYVVENQVEFDIEIESALPESAIPNINVFADVITSNDTSLIALPKSEVFTTPHRTYSIYVFNEKRDLLELRQISVAAISVDEVYIAHGLRVGEQILPVSPAVYNSAAFLSLNEVGA